jgi:hypothetical protein
MNYKIPDGDKLIYFSFNPNFPDSYKSQEAMELIRKVEEEIGLYLTQKDLLIEANNKI